MKLSRFKHLALAAGLLGLMALPVAAQPVALELALVVDESNSVSDEEYDLQMQGYVNAFLDPTIHNAIESQPGGIAVMMLVFASSGQNAIEVNWTHLETAADCITFSGLIDAAQASREFHVPGNTGIADAIRETRPLFFSNSFTGARLVMDISGDGEETGESDAVLNAERDTTFASGININGLAILTTEFPDLDDYYASDVVTPGGFVEVANNFADFEAAVVRKLGAEIGSGAPEPGTFALLGVGALALGGLVARRKKS